MNGAQNATDHRSVHRNTSNTHELFWKQAKIYAHVELLTHAVNHGKLKRSIPNKCNTDGQPEITMWFQPPISEMLISLKLTQSIEISTTYMGLSTSASMKAKLESTDDWDNNGQPTTKNGNVAILGGNLAISGWPSLSQLLGDNFVELKITNLPLKFGRYLTCVKIPEINISGFGGHVPTSSCRSLLQSLADSFSSFTWS